MQIRIIADDLSGAADCAAAFARAVGGEMPVYLGEPPRDGSSLAVDVDSRAKDAGTASLTVQRSMESITAAKSESLVFKKIDSTLRGHIGAELLAALAAEPAFDGVVVSPAFPEQGRALRGGRLHVNGRVAAAQSSDLVAMLSEAGLRPALLDNPQGAGAALGERIAGALRGGARAVVVDAEHAEDLMRLARAIDALAPVRVLVAGSAGLARALAVGMAAHSSHARSSENPSADRRPGGVVAVVGSFSAISMAQVGRLAEQGRAEVLRCDPDQWLDTARPGGRADALGRAEALIAAGRSVVFAIGGAPAAHASRAVVRSIAATIAPLLQRASSLVLTGGDTARAVLDSLRVQRLDVRGEFEPGISFGCTASLPGTRIFIKAGAFGDEMALHRLLEHLEATRPAGRLHELTA